jgi:predicted dehydrogenase
MGYDDLKVVEAREFLHSIAEGRPHGAHLGDAVRAAEVLDALAASAEEGAWVGVPTGAGIPVAPAGTGRP